MDCGCQHYGRHHRIGCPHAPVEIVCHLCSEACADEDGFGPRAEPVCGDCRALGLEGCAICGDPTYDGDVFCANHTALDAAADAWIHRATGDIEWLRLYDALVRYHRGDTVTAMGEIERLDYCHSAAITHAPLLPAVTTTAAAAAREAA